MIESFGRRNIYKGKANRLVNVLETHACDENFAKSTANPYDQFQRENRRWLWRRNDLKRGIARKTHVFFTTRHSARGHIFTNPVALVSIDPLPPDLMQNMHVPNPQLHLRLPELPFAVRLASCYLWYSSHFPCQHVAPLILAICSCLLRHG